MGVYLIAAGTSSKNRKKSLDKAFKTSDLLPYLPDEIKQKLYSCFGEEESIYVWGANKGSLHQLKQVRPGEYVVDVKNKKVMNAFTFCFWYKANDTKLQDFIGWDEEKPSDKQRPYHYVYFFKKPRKPENDNKSYYARAFNQEHNQNWLVGQRYFSDHEVDMALERMGVADEEELLGI